MIEYLRLTNFRRHENTEITLAEGEQTIVVSGRNGAGKSTIIEGIVYALLGEGRHGRNGLDRLVRRGAEIEGMEVELGFDLEGTKYRIVRRRDGKTASAVLSVNGQSAVEGTKSVTAAVEDILGMDSQGIKLAIVAQQKELDLLVKMGASTRVRAIGRLLRLDAIGRARDEARGLWRVASNALDAMPETKDLVMLAKAVAESERSLASIEAAEKMCRGELTMLEASLAASAHVEQEYANCREELARIDGELAAVTSEVARLQSEYDTIRIVDVPEIEANTAVLQRRGAELEHRIAQAEANRRVVEQREMLGKEMARDRERSAAIRAFLEEGTAEEWLKRAEAARVDATLHREAAQDASARREALREDLGKWRGIAESARTKRDAILALSGVCDTCGQTVGEEHKHTVEASTEAAIFEADSAIRGIVEEGQGAKAAYEEAQALSRRAEEEAAGCAKRAEQAAAREGELSELERRIAAYELQVKRLDAGDEADVEDLYRQKGALAIAVSEARAAEEAARAREAAVDRREQLQKALTDATRRLKDTEMRQKMAAISRELEASWEDRNEMLDRQRAEMGMLTVLVEQTAEARQLLERTRTELRHANELSASRARQQERGKDAANAQRLLDDVERAIGGAIRPGLESAISDILCQMSQGRFTSVKVNAEYDVTVLDDGSYRQIGELSGGEADLVALAIRLGVADIVCQRNGAIGFLILDEPFGSQDAERRESIITALRALRSRYGQIWCISHVGGLDDVADRVIEVELADDGTSSAE